MLRQELQMSRYLLAFANGPFKYLESSYKSPLSGTVRRFASTVCPSLPALAQLMRHSCLNFTLATSDVIHQAQFALDVKTRVLPLYEKVFDVEYPLPKLDTLDASDFDAEAMENWVR